VRSKRNLHFPLRKRAQFLFDLRGVPMHADLVGLESLCHFAEERRDLGIPTGPTDTRFRVGDDKVGIDPVRFENRSQP
jgi:hypothetical protein